jgi:hypothetical protein
MWLITRTLCFPRGPAVVIKLVNLQKMKESADVLIIGAGATGLAAARGAGSYQESKAERRRLEACKARKVKCC